jgi:hypothetical protein
MKKSTLLMGAALLGATASITPAAVNAATNTTNTTAQTQTQSSMVILKGTLKVAVGKTVPVYASPNDTTPITGKTLKAGSSWRYFGQENANGYLWINLGGNQWVNSADPSAFSLISAPTTTAKAATSKTSTATKATTKTDTTAPASVVTPGKVTITPGHSVSIYTSPSADTPTSKKLAGGTTWKMFSQVTYRGYLWVNVGGNQWINDSDANALNLTYTTAKTSKTATKTTTKTASKTSTKTSTTKSGVTSISGTVKIHYVPGYGIAVWDAPQDGSVTGKKLADGSSWRVFQTTTVNGVPWYNLGGNQWISGTYAKLTSSTSANKTVAKSGTITTNSKARTNIYASASTKKVTRTVGKNVKLKYYGTTTVKGQLWYSIGGGEWVNGADVK